MNSLISIIVPVYKVEEFIDECVQSIVDQTYKNLEIILVDDGSPDNSPSKCDEWAKKDSRVKVIHKKNGGASSARNAGLEIAAGDYIGFVDGDDYIHPKMYEVLLESLQNSNKKIAYCEPFRVLENGNISSLSNVSKKAVLGVEDALNETFYGNVNVSVWSKLYEKCVFDNIRFPEGEINEEYPLIIPTMTLSGGMVHSGESLYYYRAREGSVTNSYWNTDVDIVLKNLRIIKQQINSNGLNKLKSYKVFFGMSAYSTALCLDKNYTQINNNAKKNHREYISIMRQNLFSVLASRYVKIKDKILYLMIATRTLRPIYKMLGRL